MLKNAIRAINKPCSPSLYVGEFCSLMLMFGVSIVACTICVAIPLVFDPDLSILRSGWKPMGYSCSIVAHILLGLGLLVSQKFAGQIILDMGRSRSRKVLVFGMSTGFLLWAAWGEVQMSTSPQGQRFWGFHILSYLLSYPLAVFVCGGLGTLIVVSLMRNQFRERGVWISFRLLEWQRLTSYRWLKVGKPEKDDYVELHLKTDSCFPFLCRGIIEVHDTMKTEVDQILQRYGVIEK